MARLTKLTDQVRANILQGLRNGLTRSAAAGAAGIDRSYMGRWCDANAAFAADCSIAEAEAEARFTMVVADAALAGDSKVAIEWLKRRRREDWGDNLSLTKMTDDDLIAFVAGSLSGDAAPGPETAPGERHP